MFRIVSTFFISVEFIKLISGQNTPNITKTGNPFENLYYWLEKINNNPDSSWKAGKNFDIRLPLSYARKLTGTLPAKGSASLLYKSFSDSDLQEIKKDLPESFDAREKWNYCKSLQEIRDQGDCGSCWAVAAVGVLADRLCIATHGAFNGHISIEDLLTCCKMCGAGCEGGYVDNAWIYLKFVGAVTGGDYNSRDGCMPYSIQPCSHYSGGLYPKCSVEEPMITPECKHNCSNLYYPLPFSEDHKKVITAYKVQPDVTKIQAELLHHGPVQVVYDVFEDFLSYKSGVYKRTLSPQNRFVGLHAVKLIGWGTDRETGLPYWLVQNSWNVEWGDNGLFKIVRGINDCNFEIDLYAGLPQEEAIL